MEELEEIFEEIDRLIERIDNVENTTYGEFDEYLDDSFEEYKIGNLTFYPSQILRNCDKVAYEEFYREQVEYLKEDYEYELKEKIEELEMFLKENDEFEILKERYKENLEEIEKIKEEYLWRY